MHSEEFRAFEIKNDDVTTRKLTSTEKVRIKERMNKKKGRGNYIQDSPVNRRTNI